MVVSLATAWRLAVRGELMADSNGKEHGNVGEKEEKECSRPPRCRACGVYHGSVNVERACMRARIDALEASEADMRKRIDSLEESERKLHAIQKIGTEAHKLPVANGGMYQEMQQAKRRKP
jgi:hypothetical protein